MNTPNAVLHTPGHKATAALQPHEQRVVQEAIELDARADALSAFMVGSVYPTLEMYDRELLRRQLSAMLQYSRILAERIKRFSPQQPENYGGTA